MIPDPPVTVIPTPAAAAPQRPTNTGHPVPDPTPTYPPAPIITTPDFVIRPTHPLDAPAIAHLCNDPTIASVMTNRFPSPYTLAAAYSWIHLNLSAPELTHFAICAPGGPAPRALADDPAGVAGIPAGAPGGVVGHVGAVFPDDPWARRIVLGYWVGREFRGRGIAKRALREFTRWCWEAWPEVVRIGAEVFGDNVASARTMEAGGFAREGTLRWVEMKAGMRKDLITYGMCRDEWEERGEADVEGRERREVEWRREEAERRAARRP